MKKRFQHRSEFENGPHQVSEVNYNAVEAVKYASKGCALSNGNG